MKLSTYNLQMFSSEFCKTFHNREIHKQTKQKIDVKNQALNFQTRSQLFAGVLSNSCRENFGKLSPKFFLWNLLSVKIKAVKQ